MVLAKQKPATCTGHGPTLNISDVPEMMPGAIPSANSVARERFSQRCVLLWKETQEEYRQDSEARAVCKQHDDEEQLSQLNSMFPDLEPDLVWNISQESPSMQHAVDTLLALSAATDVGIADVRAGSATVASASESTSTTSVGITNQHDASTWPALVGSDGWEVVNYQILQQDEQDLGSAWCSAAKDAVSLPAPEPIPKKLMKLKAHEQKQNKSQQPTISTMDCVEEGGTGIFTDYELRQQRGQQRKNKLASKAARHAEVSHVHTQHNDPAAGSPEASDNDPAAGSPEVSDATPTTT